jgi:hypothetical protein
MIFKEQGKDSFAEAAPKNKHEIKCFGTFSMFNPHTNQRHLDLRQKHKTISKG